MKIINIKFILAAVVFVVALLSIYYFGINGEVKTDKSDSFTVNTTVKINQGDNSILPGSELSYVDKFARNNFGFGLDLTDEENKKFNIKCVEGDSPKNIKVEKDSSYITCHNDGEAYRVFLGWKNYAYGKISYASDVGTTILKLRDEKNRGNFVCTEDRIFPWTEKIPATISDCYVKVDDKTLYYSILFLQSSENRDVVNTITIANISVEDPMVREMLRKFIRRIKYVPTNNLVSFVGEFFSLETKVAYAGGGGGAGGGAGSCGPGDGGCGGSAGSAGGSGDGGGGGDGGFIVSCDAATGQSCFANPSCQTDNYRGTILCDGSCSAPALPSNFGRVCLATNVCGQSNQGTIGCDGTCSEKIAPPVISGYGVACQSTANSCGQKANGIIGCTGVCTAITPSDLNCTTCPAPSGNGTCDINENNSNCPADCPYVDPRRADDSTWTQATDWTLTASPNPIFSNTRSIVSWFVNGVTGCTIVGVGIDSGKETDRFSAGAVFDYPTSKLLETTDFTLTCSNAYSGRKDSKTVQVVVRTIKVREF